MNHRRHFYLYAKEHYQKGDLWEDLWRLGAHFSGVPQSRSSLMTILSDLMEEVVFEVYKNPRYVIHRFHGRIRTEITAYGADYDTGYARAVLMLLSMSPTGRDELDERFRLGDPDPNVLPLWENN